MSRADLRHRLAQIKARELEEDLAKAQRRRLAAYSLVLALFVAMVTVEGLLATVLAFAAFMWVTVATNEHDRRVRRIRDKLDLLKEF